MITTLALYPGWFWIKEKKLTETYIITLVGRRRNSTQFMHVMYCCK